MTGTAMTEADEFAEIYKLEVVEIPTNVAGARKDEDDEVYRTGGEKYEAVAALIDEAREQGPAGAGRHDQSIEKSEQISDLLKKKKVPHAVLNARFHEQEADDRRAGGRAGRRHDRDQHGRPRHRHQARRQSGDAAAQGAGRHRRSRPRARRAKPRSATRSPPRTRR